MSNLLADYQNLLAQRSQEGSCDDTEELLQLMEPEIAAQLRLCAIPHQFDPNILQALVPDMTADQAEARCDEFSKLSIIVPTAEGWFLHDETRKELMDQWLSLERIKEFAAASARLVKYFEALVARTTGEAQETARRRRMYHLVGADQEAGFAEFESLFLRARSQRRFSECASLIRLMQEYINVLTPERILWLTCFKGKLAADQLAWADAEKLFRRILADHSAPVKLLISTNIHLGHVYNQKHEWQEAIRYLQIARDLAVVSPVAFNMLPDILHDLGAAYRDLGDLDQAEIVLDQSINLATQHNNLPSLATAYNSLGTLKLKRRDNSEAIEAFQKSLDCLNSSGDIFRSAQVYNNLGIAYRNLRDWKQSERFFEESLRIKQQAGDSLGRAMALTNLALVRANEQKMDEAIATTTQAIAIFEDMHDFYNAGITLHNLGKYYLRLKKTELARQSFMEAIELFKHAAKPDEALLVSRDLEALNKKVGLPWWSWIALVIFGSVVVWFIFLVINKVSHPRLSDCQQQKLQQLLKPTSTQLSAECEIILNNLNSAEQLSEWGLTLYKQKLYDQAQAAFAKGLEKFPENLNLLSNDAELALVQDDNSRMQQRLSILQALYRKKDGVYINQYPAIMHFLLYLSDSEQKSETVLKAIEQTDKAVFYYWDFSDMQPVLKRQSLNRQKTAQLFIDFFQKRIDLNTLKSGIQN